MESLSIGSNMDLEGFNITIEANDDNSDETDSTSDYYQLWAAVLKQAVLDIKKRSQSHTDYISAYEWMMSKEHYPGTFIWVCDLLNLDPEFVKAKLIQVKQKKSLLDKPTNIDLYDPKLPEVFTTNDVVTIFSVSAYRAKEQVTKWKRRGRLITLSKTATHGKVWCTYKKAPDESI